MERTKQTHLEQLMKETQAWLLRGPGDTRLGEVYSEEILSKYGPNLAQDSHVRILRQVVSYVLEEDREKGGK